MKSFFKTVLATIVGFFVAMFLLTLVMIGIIASSASESEPFIRDGSVLAIPLSGTIAERRTEDPFLEAFDRSFANRVTMDRFRSNLRKAKADSRIAGIRLDLGPLGGSWTQLAEMRELLLDFKSEGKFVYAYIDDFGANEASYFVATVADSIFAQPETYLEMDGFYIEREFYAGTFRKYGIEADVITAGTYKSAADSYIREEFSSADREQMTAILRTFSDGLEKAVAEFSGMTQSEVNAMMNGMPSLFVADAVDRGLISALKFSSEFEEFLKERTDNRTYREVTFGRYARVSPSKAGIDVPRRAKEIAIVYAEGPILPAAPGGLFGGSQAITYRDMKKTFEELAENEDIAAIVVRINSPGGAVTTSEAVRNLFAETAKKKPLIASMGPVAASGGYWIAMGADSVLAEPNTITGSIGVVSMKLAFGPALEKNFDVSYDQIRSHRNADWFSPTRSFTAEQRRAMQNFTDETYESFLNLVAESRGMQRDEVHRVAQGRVWTGSAALEIGLIDGLGGLRDAIEIAADKAGLETYRVGVYPTPKSFLESIMESGNAQIRTSVRGILGLDQNFGVLAEQLNLMSRPQVYSILSDDFSVN